MASKVELKECTDNVLVAKFRVASEQIGINHECGTKDLDHEEYTGNLEEELLFRLKIGANASELVRKFVN